MVTDGSDAIPDTAMIVPRATARSVLALLLAAPAGAEEIPLDAIEVAGRRPGESGLSLTAPARTGSRLDLTPLQVPASLDVVAGETIRARGQTSVADAVTQNATGITSLAAPGNGNLSFASRGFAGAGSVQQLHDGTRLYVGAGTVTFPFDPWSAERIEVLRGPASVLYGEGAIGGVINVVPKRPVLAPLGEARAALGPDGTARLALDSGGPLGEAAAYRLALSGNRSDGFVRPDGDLRNLALSASLTRRVAPDLSVTLSQDLGASEPSRSWGSPLIGGRVPARIRFVNYNVQDSRIAWLDSWTQVKAEWTPRPDFAVRSTAYRLSAERHWRDVEQYRYDPATGRVVRSDYIEILHHQEQVGARLDATLRGSLFGLPHAVAVGFEVNRVAFDRDSNTPFGGESTVDLLRPVPGAFLNLAGTRRDIVSRLNQAAVFAESRLEVSPQLALVTGLRFDSPTVAVARPLAAAAFTRTFDSLGTRIGVVYDPVPGLALYAHYATAADPLGSLLTTSVAQSQFTLATGEQVEAGAKGLFTEGLFAEGRGEWTLAAYAITKDNLLVPDPDRPTLSRQVGRQSSRGMEVALSFALDERWRIDANLALLQARYDRFAQAAGGRVTSFAGNVPVDVPERVANLWIAHAFAPGWTARLGLNAVGPVFGDFANAVRRPGYALLHAGLDWQVTPDSRLSLRATNLTDRIYAVSGNANSWLLGPPRAVELAYRVTF
ncbi:TonB-dependent receptor plug [Methylobacterium sp. 4-46]|uniref:TonB-dependent receptor n=1 Tax=unclassified Methylobacterium TaxID=2615210 RepID=UPI000165C8D6|nr:MULTISPECIES: TonB-dependent receptor [Methylobacterium]ACA15385.1 TonB-dependent receptor plug [Methylobacterium sp. 4-46]WFT81106.1 TonB-dependent receptor [Methylobacterium nodulans]